LLYVGIENILSPQEWLSRLETNELSPKDLCITFDDGLRCQAEIALPVLERYGIKAFWFVYSSVFFKIPVKSEIYSYVASQCSGGMKALVADFFARCPENFLAQLRSKEFLSYSASIHRVAPFYSDEDIKFRFLRNSFSNKAIFEEIMDRIVVERGFALENLIPTLWMTDKDLQILNKKGHAIGLHSFDHPYEISKLSYEEQSIQYKKNFDHILAAIGQRPLSVAHPLNSYNSESLTILKELGIQCGFRANAAPSSCHVVNPSCLEYAREDSTNLLQMIA
jgi:peptidoglycan/xylan/chitin deacetylase (PgdA/CDA1 family)